jgi:hypothetical protein
VTIALHNSGGKDAKPKEMPAVANRHESRRLNSATYCERIMPDTARVRGAPLVPNEDTL